MTGEDNRGPGAFLQRLQAAVDAHDLPALATCFAADYINETPAHPTRGFRGRDQVVRNWAHIFSALPDIQARIIRSVVDADAVWSEWELGGTRADGSRQVMTGVTIFGVVAGAATWARFYLEPVDSADLDVDGAVRQTMAPPTPSSVDGQR